MWQRLDEVRFLLLKRPRRTSRCWLCPEQRTAEWKRQLRAEPGVARLLLRRLVGPLTLWDEAEGGLRWESEPKPAELLDGLVQRVASPAGFEPAFWP